MVEHLAYHTAKHRPKTSTGNGNPVQQPKNKLDKLQHKQQGTKQSKDYQRHHKFYPRTINLTEINFTHEEWSLLNNGIQHSIEKPLDKYWTDLIMEICKSAHSKADTVSS
jgi:hypothetical protein